MSLLRSRIVGTRWLQVLLVLVVCGISFALLQLQRNQLPAAAATLAFVAWFKYIPLLFVGYLGLRGWVSAVVTFAVTSAVVLGAAHVVSGLSEFFNNNVPGHAAQVFNLMQSGFAPHLVYVLLCMTVAGCYLAAHTRLSRGPAPAPEVEAWRRALEFSIVTTVCACFFFSHYYYLIVLVIPFGRLLVQYLANRQWGRLAVWAAAYVLVSAFVVPTGLLSRLIGVDA